MNSWFKLICLALLLNNIVMKYPEFEFHYESIGYGGFLVTCKPKEWSTETHTDELLTFRFHARIKDNPENRNMPFVTMFNSSFTVPQFDGGTCRYRLGGRFSENTLYEIRIQQFVENGSSDTTELQIEYLFDMKTSSKSKIKPAKPDFEYTIQRIEKYRGPWTKIEWLPCGKEKSCNGKEPGAFFATIASVLDRKGELRFPQVFGDTDYLYTVPGVFYEIKVISVYNDFEIESDPQEVYIEPKFGPVTRVKVVSFPNASVLVSWKPPKYSLEELLNYTIIITNDGSSIDELIHHWRNTSNTLIYTIGASNEEKLFDKPEYQLNPGVTYTFSIIPRSTFDSGFETRVKYTMPDD